ncbi:glycosyltransferase family 2 protein [Bradyrhizobium sp. BR13661]|nr:glycosyltransferase family 2 protein [Bradyrhizobium sp. BR13661]MDH6263518.1 hypothetical protein [Bradyrhizobium sp. BR13661]
MRAAEIVKGDLMSLQLLHGTELPPAGEGIPLICPIRNEIRLLPAFLRHHRKLGVSEFIFIDNNSSDESRDYLLSQPDCRVFLATGSYRESGYGVAWINEVIDRLKIRGWLVYLDVDEHLVYPAMEELSIKQYCESLTAEGFDCVNAVMIDMYPQTSFLDLTFEADENLSDVMGWFDADYVFRDWPRRFWDKEKAFRLQVIGGPRCRLLSNLDAEARHGAVFYTLANQVDRVVDLVPQSLIPLLAKVAPREMPALQKRPLNFVKAGFRYLNSHAGTNKNYATDMTALLHFKFCGELQRRFEMKKEGNHYRRGLSYIQLEDAIEAWPGSSLHYDGSCQFRSSQDLLKVGLIGKAASEVWTHSRIKAVRTSLKGARVIS